MTKVQHNVNTKYRDQSQDSLLEESTNLSRIGSDQNINANLQSTLNTVDESFDSALGEATNEISSIPHQIRKYQNKSNSTKISTRNGSYDSLLGETNNEVSIIPNLAQMNTNIQQKYVYSLINPAISQKIANRKESTRDGSYDSLLGETNNKASSDQLQHNKSNRQEQLESIANAAIAKTIADDKEHKKCTLEKAQDTAIEEEKRKKNENPKVKNAGFVNYKWTEILVEDEEEGEEIDRHDVSKVIIQMMKREENIPLDNWTEKFIRVNQKTYVQVEVAKDRND